MDPAIPDFAAVNPGYGRAALVRQAPRAKR